MKYILFKYNSYGDLIWLLVIFTISFKEIILFFLYVATS